MEEKSLAMEMLQEMKEQNARMHKIIKYLCIIIVIFFLGLVVSNGAWLIYESQYEYGYEETYTQEVGDIETSDINQSIE
jgi:hypothetical protein